MTYQQPPILIRICLVLNLVAVVQTGLLLQQPITIVILAASFLLFGIGVFGFDIPQWAQIVLYPIGLAVLLIATFGSIPPQHQMIVPNLGKHAITSAQISVGLIYTLPFLMLYILREDKDKDKKPNASARMPSLIDSIIRWIRHLTRQDTLAIVLVNTTRR